MTLNEAQQVIWNGTSAFVDVVKAANVIADDPAATPADLLRCLDFPGLPAETARMAIADRLDSAARSTTPQHALLAR
jgi:hypothetical protein